MPINTLVSPRLTVIWATKQVTGKGLKELWECCLVRKGHNHNGMDWIIWRMSVSQCLVYWRPVFFLPCGSYFLSIKLSVEILFSLPSLSKTIGCKDRDPKEVGQVSMSNTINTKKMLLKIRRKKRKSLKYSNIHWECIRVPIFLHDGHW